MSKPILQPPTLLYDGDCAFCLYWVAIWQQLTGDRVRYRVYQAARNEFPQLTDRELAAAIWLVMPDGVIHRGAAAAFVVLSLVPGRGLGWWCYRYLPGFAWCAEQIYGLIAGHRSSAMRITGLLWGKTPRQAEYRHIRDRFLQGLGLVYGVAFLSFAVQVQGLIGSEGLLPIAEYLTALRAEFGAAGYYQLPNLFWFCSADTALYLVCWLGFALSLALMLGVARFASLLGCYLLYLSLFYAGQAFTTYQWDLLLLETGFLALFALRLNGLVVFAFRWLLFRFLISAGLVKLAGGDPAWSDLTALFYHFETQPLPSPLAWYAHYWPDWLLRSLAAFTLFAQLFIPWLCFAPRRLRQFAAAVVVALQLGIALTGNYGFFNLLTILLCLWLLDDGARTSHPAIRHTGIYQQLRNVAVALLVVSGAIMSWQQLSTRHFPAVLTGWSKAIEPWRVSNAYGPFARMTTERVEIEIETSMDGSSWEPYPFRYKIGAIDRGPGWNVPHQPRLDWQMWIASVDPRGPPVWFEALLLSILEHRQPVIGLLADRDSVTPRWVRAQLYRYRLAPPSLKRRFRHFWIREPLGIYYPPFSLQDVQTPIRGIQRLR